MSASAPPLVLVTGAGGFVGGHVARTLAASGNYRVRGLVRRPPATERGDPEIAWTFGDLRDPAIRSAAVEGARFVVHCASWVRLGFDPTGQSYAVNVEATRGLLAAAEAAGVERFVYTSSLQTIAAGSVERPADEDSAWNLDSVRSPYTETKREAERIVLAANSGRMATVALCPGMAIGPRDPGPSSTRVLLEMSRSPIVTLPGGGIPVIEAEVLAEAHARALDRGEAGRRYAVVGPYLGYRRQAEIVAALTGNPRRIVNVPDRAGRPLAWVAGTIDRLAGGRWLAMSRAVVSGGFLRFHVDGSRADRAFGLVHGSSEAAIRRTLIAARDSGKAPWIRPGRLGEDVAGAR